MSIMVLNTKTIEKMGNSTLMLKEAYVDYMSVDYLERTLSALYNLNIKSWNERYSNDVITDEEIEQFYTPNFNSKEKFNNMCELLKAMKCLYINIELKELTREEKRVIDFLKDSIYNLKDHLISNLEDYKQANWG